LFLLRIHGSERQASFSFQYTSSWFESFEPLEKSTIRKNSYVVRTEDKTAWAIFLEKIFAGEGGMGDSYPKAEGVIAYFQ
jgi:hypothetical protein